VHPMREGDPQAWPDRDDVKQVADLVLEERM
jgi:hypothetical protein